MCVSSGCGEQEAGVASGSGWNLWVWLLGVVVRRYIDFLTLLIPIPLVSVLFCSSIPTFCSFIRRDEPDSPLTQYIANAGISHARYTITHFRHYHRVLQLISKRMSV